MREIRNSCGQTKTQEKRTMSLNKHQIVRRWQAVEQTATRPCCANAPEGHIADTMGNPATFAF